MQQGDFLSRIVERKRAEVELLLASRAGGDYSDESPRRTGRGRSEVRAFEDALRGPDVAVIAEIKRYSPSNPSIRPQLDPGRLAREYEANGAAALSVLTDTQGFGGSLEDLELARSATTLPVLRKDFLIDTCQIEESWERGADAVLLIAAILERKALADMVSAAAHLGLSALVEVHTEAELELALDAGARVIGVNNRDLATFRVDTGVALRLADRIPDGVLKVAESGISSPAQIEAIAEAGYDAVLVGESLLRAEEPGVLLRQLVGAGRRSKAIRRQP